MAQFRKKPVVVEAIQFNAPGDHPAVIVTEDSPTGFGIMTLEHTKVEHEVTPGDWIITGVKGECYACKPDIFASTYEPAHAREAGAQEPVAVPAGLLPRATGQSAEGGWTLPVSDLEKLREEAGEWGADVCLEAVQDIALAVESRMLAAAPVPPPAEPTPDLVETVATGRDGVQRRVYVDRARGVVMEASPPAESGEVEDPWREAGEKQVQVHEALQDSAYRAGARAGWNAQFADEPDAAIERLTRYPKGALSIIHEKRAYEKITSSNPPAAKTGVVKLLDMSNLLKHAWQAGKNGVEWVDYDPDDTPAYGRISSALASHTPAPQPGGAACPHCGGTGQRQDKRTGKNYPCPRCEHSPAQWNAGAEAKEMRDKCEATVSKWLENAKKKQAEAFSEKRDVDGYEWLRAHQELMLVLQAIRALPLPTPPAGEEAR